MPGNKSPILAMKSPKRITREKNSLVQNGNSGCYGSGGGGCYYGNGGGSCVNGDSVSLGDVKGKCSSNNNNKTAAKTGGLFRELRHTMKELHKQHRNKLEDITLRFETIKVTLSEKVESLKGECEDHLRRARRSEEALQKDADVKVQMALAPYLSLPKEIESLKTVVEMRNDEIQKLRTRNMDLEKQLEEIPRAKDKITSLQQKVENLQAIINIKSDHEKQLHDKCQLLMKKYDRETRANKRLSMDYEQVVWRMSQSEYGSSESLTKRQLSRSPPRSETTSPDARRRGPASSPNGEVKLRVKRRTESDSERSMRSRSATFVLEKDEDIDQLTQSPPSSPLSTPRRWRNRTDHREGPESREDFSRRMCQSAGAELTTELSENRNDFESLESNPEFIGSYARSLSGVSDSGVCDGLHSGYFDSMTGSDMLNSSIFSAESDGVNSNNVSLMLESMRGDDHEALPGQEIASSNTVVDMSAIQWAGTTPTDGTPSSFSEASSYFCSSVSANDTVMEGTFDAGADDEFQARLPDRGEEEEVFETQDIS